LTHVWHPLLGRGDAKPSSTNQQKELNMYYISQENYASPARVVKRLKDFKAKEGTRWLVRQRKEIRSFDFYPVYEIVNGKLKKDRKVHHAFWI